MKKRYIILLIIIALVLSVIGYQTIFFTFNRLGEGETFKEEVISPFATYSAQAYYRTYGGAAGGAVIWVIVTNEENKKEKIVYYANGNRNFKLEWVGERHLSILNHPGKQYPKYDDSIILDVEEEIFDASGRACKSWLMKSTYKACYER